jgi:DNA-binding transcriptional ArsR family regulator
MTTADADAVFVALADPTRRALLDVLGSRPSASASALARELPVTRQAILKHLAVLADCALVSSSRDGREVLYRVRPEPLVSTARWLTDVAAQWDGRLADLKRRAEQPDH